ncbi:hypothetical protein SK128_002749 [Halocaridina rubra]|uniref:Uncharacterized protein n=1 Tax=Halocaridina rubra TaxID=373956 RepID=A0AAN8WSA8_HALRR
MMTERDTPRLHPRCSMRSLKPDFKNSSSDVQSYESRSSLRSLGGEKSVEMTQWNGKGGKMNGSKLPEHGKTLIDEEESQTGKASVAGSNVWLSLWSTSGMSNSTNSLNSTDMEIVKNKTDFDNVISREVFLAGYGIFGVAQGRSF